LKGEKAINKVNDQDVVFRKFPNRKNKIIEDSIYVLLLEKRILLPLSNYIKDDTKY